MPRASYLVVVLATASILLASVPATATSITLTFETFPGPDGILGSDDDVPVPSGFLTPLSDQFSSVGIAFSQGSLLQDSFFDGNPNNHFISSTNPIGTFSTPVFGISIQSNSIWNATLTAFDTNNNIMATDELINPNAGSSFLVGMLSVTTLQPIYGFSILPPISSQILNLDNMVLITTAVPEPSTFVLIGLGLTAIARPRLRRRST